MKLMKKKMKMEMKSLQAPWKEGDRETRACLYRRSQTSNMYRLPTKKAMAVARAEEGEEGHFHGV
jgi:hypothetical protein